VTSCAFALMRRQVWDEVKFRAKPDWATSNRCPWYDYAFFKDVKLLGWDWLTHFGVCPKHWQSNGSYLTADEGLCVGPRLGMLGEFGDGDPIYYRPWLLTTGRMR